MLYLKRGLEEVPRQEAKFNQSNYCIIQESETTLYRPHSGSYLSGPTSCAAAAGTSRERRSPCDRRGWPR